MPTDENQMGPEDAGLGEVIHPVLVSAKNAVSVISRQNDLKEHLPYIRDARHIGLQDQQEHGDSSSLRQYDVKRHLTRTRYSDDA